MNKFNGWPVLGCVVLAATLAGCGSSDSSTGGALRLVNATVTHASLDLLVNTAVVASATAADSASAYTTAGATTNTLQLNDTGSATSLLTVSAALGAGQHYTVVAYEQGGAVKTAVLTEDFAVPAAGTAQLRIYDADTDAGTLDVYITAPTTDLATVASPTTSITADTGPISGVWLPYGPGTYRVRVTGRGGKSDVRIDMPLTLTALQVATVVLTPASGGLLVNGATLTQQGSYAATRNTTARVRLTSAVSGSATVAATAGSTTIDAGTAAPNVGAYIVVPAAGVLAINVNGSAITPPAAGLTVGSDSTLLVYGSPGSATATLLADDNRRPTSTANVKMRLVNGITGTQTPLTLAANFTPVASNIAAGAASTYGLVAGSTTMRIDVTSPSLPNFLAPQTGLSIGGDSVYTVFMLGDSATPRFDARRDDR